MKRLPQTRSANIVQQELNGEMLIYDLQNNTAYNLNETSTIIYQACDGETTFDELKSKQNFTDDFIYFALDQLNAKNLLEDYSSDNFSGMNRRDVIKKVGLVSMIALPMISSLIAPTSANAASGGAAPLTIISFSTPGTPQTSQQCNLAIQNGRSRCASNTIQPWNNNGSDNNRNCEGRCISAV